MDSLLDTIEYKGFNIQVHRDDVTESPRDMFDQFGKMVCFHSRYNLGDKHDFDADTVLRDLAVEAYPDIEELIEYFEDGYGWELIGNVEKVDSIIESMINRAIDSAYIMLPLYLYDHSGITMSVNPFHCPWDSGQVGFIYCSRKEAKEEFGDDFEDRAIKLMKSEVEEYDHFLTGQIYGYMIEPTEHNTTIECDDSCWGFYGDSEYMISEAKESIDHAINTHKKGVREQLTEKREVDEFVKSCWAY